MKLRIAGAFLAIMIIQAGICMADSGGSAAVEANIQSVFSLEVTPESAQLDLIPGGYPEADTKLMVTSNEPWRVTVKSDTPDGHMSQWSIKDTKYIINGMELANPMMIGYDDTSFALSGQEIRLFPYEWDTDHNYYWECGENMENDISFSQHIDPDEWSKRVDPRYYMFRIVVTFTGSQAY